ncbi:IPExxxVDY family protein [Pedobacter sp. HMF7056]|uniref:IPExxxVDY family protein n=1 Tax=Hufsiella ginkgonis TaxID=2695274 RepID=A0A7K1XT27_9SPHI|nr:IPExxxVDY family protein [Hufsiella ginkgonis]MXV14151.1 IPExxxVDY family protein [Hufsiella ginkgonis]
MNKLILRYEPDLDFVLIAITAPLKDYRLCFKVNKQLRIQFARIDELSLQQANISEVSWFTRYNYFVAETETDYYLIANKGTEGFLVPEMKTADFFILIRSYIDVEELSALISALNKIPEVLVAAEVDPKRLKSKENLIF